MLVFDKGSNSRENIEALRNGPCHVIGSLVPSQHPDLLAVPPSQFRALEQWPGVSTWRTVTRLHGADYTVVVVKNQHFAQAQTATLLREIARCRQQLREIQRQLRRWEQGLVTRGRHPAMDTVGKRVQHCHKAQHMKKLFRVSIDRSERSLPRLTYRFDHKAWRRLQQTLLGKNLIFTDRGDLSDAQIVHGYRSQHHVERAFRDLKDARHLAIRPQHHWTDQKIRIHVFICVLALMLQTLLCRHLARSGCTLSGDRILEELAAIREVGVVYPATGRSRPLHIKMTLSTLSEEQEKLYRMLQLERYRNR